MDRQRALTMMRDHIDQYHASGDALEMAVHAANVLHLAEMLDQDGAFDPPCPLSGGETKYHVLRKDGKSVGPFRDRGIADLCRNLEEGAILLMETDA